jgi:glycerophosphoryl diester phosphodiesterase
MPHLPWLTARPIAHRGLHDEANGVVENTPGAARAAIAGGYAIECDVQITSDGEAMVFHDDTLERLTEGSGAVAAYPAAQLRQVAFKGTSDRMATLGEYCDLIAERAMLVIELKSRFDGDLRIATRTVAVMRSYGGAFALMSFDPALVTEVRRLAPEMTRGIVSESNYNDPYWNFLTLAQRSSLTWMTHAPASRPQFIAHNVNHLPALLPQAGRALFGIPILTWTVRTEAQRTRAARIADQVIFEGFRP